MQVYAPPTVKTAGLEFFINVEPLICCWTSTPVTPVAPVTPVSHSDYVTGWRSDHMMTSARKKNNNKILHSQFSQSEHFIPMPTQQSSTATNHMAVLLQYYYSVTAVLNSTCEHTTVDFGGRCDCWRASQWGGGPWSWGPIKITNTKEPSNHTAGILTQNFPVVPVLLNPQPHHTYWKKLTNHKAATECSKTEPVKLSTSYRYWYCKWYPLAPGLCCYGYQCFYLFLVVVLVQFLYWYWSQELLRTILHRKKIFLTLKSP